MDHPAAVPQGAPLLPPPGYGYGLEDAASTRRRPVAVDPPQPPMATAKPSVLQCDSLRRTPAKETMTARPLCSPVKDVESTL